MGNAVIEDRLRAARPEAADVDEDAFDAELLAHIQRLPIERRRTAARRVAIPVATAGVTLAAAAALMFAGGPGDLGGPSSAAAIEQALHWFNPPAGTVLHVRSIETQGGRTTTRESWQDADDPTANREVLDGPIRYETAGDGLYDPTTNTIYQGAAARRRTTRGRGSSATRSSRRSGTCSRSGHMTVTGRERHNGQDAWEISLNADAGRPVWKVWVSAADGKPLELRDPGRDANEEPSTIRWETYEVLDGADAARLVTLQGAHPTAKVVSDRARSTPRWSACSAARAAASGSADRQVGALVSRACPGARPTAPIRAGRRRRRGLRRTTRPIMAAIGGRSYRPSVDSGRLARPPGRGTSARSISVTTVAVRTCERVDLLGASRRAAGGRSRTACRACGRRR